ncbi:hypothetical protein [Paracoccus sp. Ld10]|uniref:hypothetical protein n=1 Tax=Paracoccus sp. Ld10 TaxID=649158 RepID=UPI00386F98AA
MAADDNNQVANAAPCTDRNRVVKWHRIDPDIAPTRRDMVAADRNRVAMILYLHKRGWYEAAIASTSSPGSEFMG